MWDSPALRTQAARHPIVGAGPFLPATVATHGVFPTEWLPWICFPVGAGSSFLDRITVMLIWQNNSPATWEGWMLPQEDFESVSWNPGSFMSHLRS